MDDIKLFTKNEKKIGKPYTSSENVQSGYRDGIWHRKIHHVDNEKQETRRDGRNRTSMPRQNQNIWRKGNCKFLVILEMYAIKVNIKGKIKN